MPMPDILDIIPGKYSATNALLKPTASKLHPPLYALSTDMPILDIIFKSPLSTDFMYRPTHSLKLSLPNSFFSYLL